LSSKNGRLGRESIVLEVVSFEYVGIEHIDFEGVELKLDVKLKARLLKYSFLLGPDIRSLLPQRYL
jgi:hypothetical protein